MLEQGSPGNWVNMSPLSQGSLSVPWLGLCSTLHRITKTDSRLQTSGQLNAVLEGQPTQGPSLCVATVSHIAWFAW